MTFMAATAIALLVLAATLMCCPARADNPSEKKGGCHLSDIKVSQAKTGKVVQGQPEYRVTIENLCRCSQTDVQLHCNRLPSVEPIDSTQIKVEDELCMVAGAMFKGSRFAFTYAWKTPQDFKVVSAVALCEEVPPKWTMI